MTMTVLDRALVAGDAGRVTGERQERPDPEVPERARRRTFTAQYKLDVVAEYDANTSDFRCLCLPRVLWSFSPVTVSLSWLIAGFPVPGRDEGPRDAVAGVQFHGPRSRQGQGVPPS
jgi:hypothetical protein